MPQLARDLLEVRRLRREWRREAGRGPRWWEQGLLWGNAVLGTGLLIWGDTVERVFGVVFLAGPAVIAGITLWMYWKALRILRGSRPG